MNNCDDLTQTFKYLIQIGNELSTLTGNAGRKHKFYWVRSLEQFSLVITKKIVDVYKKDNVPREKWFNGLRVKIVEDLYDNFEDELSHELLEDKGNGKKKVNDEWLRINSNGDNEEFCDEFGEAVSGFNYNRGLKLTIVKRTDDEKLKKLVDIEIPLSEMYMAAIYVLKEMKITQPHYPYCIIYGIYQLFRHSVPIDRIKQQIIQTIEKLISSNVLEKDEGKIDQSIGQMKKAIKPFIDSNRGTFTDMLGGIKGGIKGMSVQQIEEVADQAHNAIKALNTKGKDFKETIGEMIGSNGDEVKKKMEQMGLHEKNIRAVIDNVSGSMTNTELYSTIPSSIDDLLNNNVST